MYDSKSEKEFHSRNPSLKYNEKSKDLYEGFLFRDENGWGKTARLDFYDPRSKAFIEYKAAPLNFIRTMRESEEKLKGVITGINRSNKSDYAKGCAKRKAYLQYGWNHSAYKQSSVSKEVSRRGNKFVVVFKDNTFVTRKKGPSYEVDHKRYTDLGINWILESDIGRLMENDMNWKKEANKKTVNWKDAVEAVVKEMEEKRKNNLTRK